MSAIIGPLPSSSTPAPAQETLNLQLQPGSVGALSQLTPLIAADGATIQATTIAGLYEVQGPTANLGQLALELSANPAVQYADPAQTVSDLTVPNDPDYTNGDEWQFNGTWGINVPGAWSVTTGSDQVIVADTDTGINYNDPDLYDNVWINQAEIPATVLPNLTDVYNDGVITFTDLNNSVNQGPGKIVDTNGDGIITATDLLASTSAGGWADGSTQDGDTAHPDDLIGWNFARRQQQPDRSRTATARSPRGRSPPSATTGSASRGSTGTRSSCRCSSSTPRATGPTPRPPRRSTTRSTTAPRSSTPVGAASGTDPTIAAAIQYADQHGVIIVAAAGNNGTDDDNSSTLFSPASYSVDYPNLISVAATDSNGDLASFSNYGVASVQLAAPGVNVYSTRVKRHLRHRQRHLDGRAPGHRHDRAGGGRPSELVDEPGHRRGPRHHHPRPQPRGQGDHRRHRQRGRRRRQHRRALRRLQLRPTARSTAARASALCH